MEINELNKKAHGGTELLMERLHNAFPSELLDNFQIIPSRVRELKKDKIRILYCHDLAEDPEARAALENGKWKNYHKIVFVSNWQMQRYIDLYKIPWSHCMVIVNSIDPIEFKERETGPVRLIYHSTPHRGLNILVPVFEKIAEIDNDVILDVYSSFELYGWKERDKPFEDIFQRCKDHPQINYHGSKSNEEIRTALQQADIFAYPSIWQETSCLCLIEAMSAGCLAIHPNYGALYETSLQLTNMYQWEEDINNHASIFHFLLMNGINQVRCNENIQYNLKMQSDLSNMIYNWDLRKKQWDYLFNFLKDTVTDTSIPKTDVLIFNTGS